MDLRDSRLGAYSRPAQSFVYGSGSQEPCITLGSTIRAITVGIAGNACLGDEETKEEEELSLNGKGSWERVWESLRARGKRRYGEGGTIGGGGILRRPEFPPNVCV